MEGKIYSADYMHSTLATFENGYVYTFPNNHKVGHYDTNETGNKNVYDGASTWQNILIGNVEYNQAYIKPYKDTSDLYIRGDCIYDNQKRLVAKFEGNPKDALCACVICVHLGLITLNTNNAPTQTTKNLATSSSSSSIISSNTTSNDAAGGTGCLGMLLAIIIGIAVIAFIIWLAIDSIPFFWGKLFAESMQKLDTFALFFCYLPLIACYIVSSVVTCKKAKSSKFTEIVKDIISMLFGFVAIVGIIATIAAIILFIQHGSILYAILIPFILTPLYWIISMIPAIIVSLVTWIAVKIKLL